MFIHYNTIRIDRFGFIMYNKNDRSNKLEKHCPNTWRTVGDIMQAKEKTAKTEYCASRIIGILTEDASLFRKLCIALRSEATVLMAADVASVDEYDLLIADMRNDEAEITSPRIIPLVKRGETTGARALPYPFSFEELRSVVRSIGGAAKRLIIEGDGRHVCLDGERIRLTESEHRLLSAMAEGNGEFVPREALVRSAFGENQDGGILNVYVHYLREKLERNGEKIILSSRKAGYKIDKKYLGVKG